MTVLIVQHLAPEQPATVLDALTSRGLDVRVARVDLGDPLPDRADELDALVVLGGPMSARSDEGYPTRAAELALVAGAVEGGVPFLGICLGAQVLAAATGGEVVDGTGAEIGWAPVTLSDAAAHDPLLGALAGPPTVLHWHGETFVLPPGAVLLASSAAYPHQAFRVGDAAWGLQFHLEVDLAAVERFVAAFADEAATAPGGARGILDGAPAALAELDRAGGPAVLDRFAELAAERAQRTTS
ncbi:MAG: type 1 glutamine amidotransferase [Acidimicrobiia bacterium]